MKMRKFAGFMLAGTMLLSTLSGCGSTIVDQAGSAGAESAASSEQTQSTEDKTDLTEKVSLKINYAAGNKSRTITYNQESPLTLPDGTVQHYEEDVNRRYEREIEYFTDYALGDEQQSCNPPALALNVLKLTLGENVQ